MHVDTAVAREVADKGERIYQKIRDQLSSEHHGEYLAIEVDSGRYFIGDSHVEAFEAAQREFPNKVFYFVRIGFDYLDEMSHIA